MSDITKCADESCPYKLHCKRFTTPIDNLAQSYFLASPLQKGWFCEYYMSTFSIFSEGDKLGMKQGEDVIIPPVYEDLGDVLGEFSSHQKRNQKKQFLETVMTNQEIDKVINYLHYGE